MHTKKPKKFTHVKIEVQLYKKIQKQAKKAGLSNGVFIECMYSHIYELSK